MEPRLARSFAHTGTAALVGTLVFAFPLLVRAQAGVYGRRGFGDAISMLTFVLVGVVCLYIGFAFSTAVADREMKPLELIVRSLLLIAFASYISYDLFYQSEPRDPLAPAFIVTGICAFFAGAGLAFLKQRMSKKKDGDCQK